MTPLSEDPTRPAVSGSTPCHNCAGDGRLSVPDGIVMCQQCAGSGVNPQAEIARLREESADLRNTLLSVLAHLEGRSDMSTDGNWEPRMIALIRKRVGWPERSEP